VRALPGKTPHGVTTNVATGLINPRQITLSLPNNLRTMNTDPVNGYLKTLKTFFYETFK